MWWLVYMWEKTTRPYLRLIIASKNKMIWTYFVLKGPIVTEHKLTCPASAEMQRVKNGSNMNIINIQDNEILIQAKRSYYENIFTFLLIDYPSCLLYDIIIDTRCLFAFIKRIKINVMLCKYYIDIFTPCMTNITVIWQHLSKKHTVDLSLSRICHVFAKWSNHNSWFSSRL